MKVQFKLNIECDIELLNKAYYGDAKPDLIQHLHQEANGKFLNNIDNINKQSLNFDAYDTKYGYVPCDYKTYSKLKIIKSVINFSVMNAVKINKLMKKTTVDEENILNQANQSVSTHFMSFFRYYRSNKEIRLIHHPAHKLTKDIVYLMSFVPYLNSQYESPILIPILSPWARREKNLMEKSQAICYYQAWINASTPRRKELIYPIEWDLGSNNHINEKLYRDCYEFWKNNIKKIEE